MNKRITFEPTIDVTIKQLCDEVDYWKEKD